LYEAYPNYKKKPTEHIINANGADTAQPV